jgi:hypothetical protein
VSTTRNNRGQWFKSGTGGTYPINDGDPQNDVEEFDEDAADREADAAEELSNEIAEAFRDER